MKKDIRRATRNLAHHKRGAEAYYGLALLKLDRGLLEPLTPLQIDVRVCTYKAAAGNNGLCVSSYGAGAKEAILKVDALVKSIADKEQLRRAIRELKRSL